MSLDVDRDELEVDQADSDYDYLDNLMKDVMGDSSNDAEQAPDDLDQADYSESQATTSEERSISSEAQAYEDDVRGNLANSGKLNDKSDGDNESNKEKSVKRVPLFARIGLDLNNNDDESDDNNDERDVISDEFTSNTGNETDLSDEVVNDTSDSEGESSESLDRDLDKNSPVGSQEEDLSSKKLNVKEEIVGSSGVNSADSEVKDDEIKSDVGVEGMLYGESSELGGPSFPEDSGLSELSSPQEEADDMFDELFEGLGVDDYVEESVEQESSDVIVPLETPEMRDVKVTSDGTSLADMLAGMRGGRKTVAQVADEMRSSDNVVEVGGKKYSDDRYVKHVEVIEREVSEQDRRRELSKKFIQRNAKFTEQEKIIMENLDMNNSQFTDLMRSTELSLKQKEEIIGLGRYGAEKHFKGRKYRTTVGDMAMLEFLVKFKFANTRILRWISNEPQGRTWRKLDRLRDNGLVESQTLIGIPDLWAATYAGVGVSGHTYDPGLRPPPKMITISSSLGVNYIAACLWFNTVNVLNLDDYPAHNRIISLQEDGRDRVRGETLISELEIRSSLGKEINPQSTTMQSLGDDRLYDIISSNVRGEIDEWALGGQVGDSPEMLLGNEYMWVLFPTSQLTLSYHVPDLVVKRERGPNGEPRSIAVEMERYDKSNDKYDKIMLAYKLDTHLYKKVVWITPNTRVARALERAARSVGFTRYTIVPIITETGTYNKQDIWLI